MRSLDIAATGMLAQQRNVEVVANNLANMNTTAFMRRRTEFHDLIYQDLRRVGTTSSDSGTVVPTGAQLGLGVKMAAVYRIHEQGNLEATDNTFDMAIQGKGFFQITLPTGETAYSRDGTFQLDADGDIVTHDGFTLEPGITVPNNAIDVTINQSGDSSAGSSLLTSKTRSCSNDPPAAFSPPKRRPRTWNRRKLSRACSKDPTFNRFSKWRR